MNKCGLWRENIEKKTFENLTFVGLSVIKKEDEQTMGNRKMLLEKKYYTKYSVKNEERKFR